MNIATIFYKFPDRKPALRTWKKFAGAMILAVRIAGRQKCVVKRKKAALAGGIVMVANPASMSWPGHSLKRPKYLFKSGFLEFLSFPTPKRACQAASLPAIWI